MPISVDHPLFETSGGGGMAASPGFGDPIFRPTEPKSVGPRNPARRLQLNARATDALRRSRADPPTLIDGWTELQTVRPSIRPPQRDSQLKHVIRTLIPAAKFHELQQSQKAKTAFRPVTVPPDIGDGPVMDVSLLVVNFVNEIHDRFDASAFFYERFLDLIEFSLDTEDEPGVSPGEMIARARASHDMEQVRCVIDLADQLFLKQLRSVLGSAS
jgi:hypothetical protein